MELGQLVTDETKLWQFIRGLKADIRKEVLRDANLQTLSDAILAAERIDAADKFADNFDTFKRKNKQYKQDVLNDYTEPMEIDNLY